MANHIEKQQSQLEPNEVSKNIENEEFKKAINELKLSYSKPKIQIFSLDGNRDLNFKINDPLRFNEKPTLLDNMAGLNEIEKFINIDLEIKPIKGNPFKERLLKLTKNKLKKTLDFKGDYQGKNKR